MCDLVEIAHHKIKRSTVSAHYAIETPGEQHQCSSRRLQDNLMMHCAAIPADGSFPPGHPPKKHTTKTLTCNAPPFEMWLFHEATHKHKTETKKSYKT